MLLFRYKSVEKIPIHNHKMLQKSLLLTTAIGTLAGQLGLRLRRLPLSQPLKLCTRQHQALTTPMLLMPAFTMMQTTLRTTLTGTA